MASDDLTKMIDTLVETKTFGLDAIDGVKALRDKAADLEKKLIAAAIAATGASETNAKQSALLQSNAATIAAWEKREADLRGREAKMAELEKSVAVEQARSNTVISCFDKLFANRTVRETIQSNVPTVLPPTYPGGPHTQSWATENKSVTREEG